MTQTQQGALRLVFGSGSSNHHCLLLSEHAAPHQLLPLLSNAHQNKGAQHLNLVERFERGYRRRFPSAELSAIYSGILPRRQHRWEYRVNLTDNTLLCLQRDTAGRLTPVRLADYLRDLGDTQQVQALADALAQWQAAGFVEISWQPLLPHH